MIILTFITIGIPTRKLRKHSAKHAALKDIRDNIKYCIIRNLNNVSEWKDS
jgi:hypothetical protein